MQADQTEQSLHTRRLTGTLVRIHKDGYGFLEVGEGKPDYFILRSKVPAAHWRLGTPFEFTPGPPGDDGRAPLARTPKPLPAEHRRASHE